jgi:hypothetical protein
LVGRDILREDVRGEVPWERRLFFGFGLSLTLSLTIVGADWPTKAATGFGARTERRGEVRGGGEPGREKKRDDEYIIEGEEKY